MEQLRGCTYNESQFLFQVANVLGLKFDGENEVLLFKENYLLKLQVNGSCVLSCAFQGNTYGNKIGVSGKYSKEKLCFSICKVENTELYLMYRENEGFSFLKGTYIYNDIMEDLAQGMRVIKCADIKILTNEENNAGYALLKVKK